MPGMDEFFAHRRIRHRITRDWRGDGQRHWFKVDPAMTVGETRELLELVPIGAFVQCFDHEFESPSDPGAWVALQRFPELWTATFSNHGWSSSPVAIDFDDATLLFWECRDFDYCKFLGIRDQSQQMAHSGLKTELPADLVNDPSSKLATHIRQRIAGIKQRQGDASSAAAEVD
jgi:hypothetical protein